jgi:hypothetical protein
MSTPAVIRWTLSFLMLSAFILTPNVSAQTAGTTSTQTPTSNTAGTTTPDQNRISCESEVGGRQHCDADTSSGVSLVKLTGTEPCLLGKTWGYDDTGVWVSDGCSGEFVVGPAAQGAKKTKTPEHIPNLGFLLYEGEKGEIYFRLFSYARYLNQKSLNPTFVDAFGNVKTIQIRQDIQLQKFFSPFAGWFLTPKFRYYLYVWSSNPSQGDPAQVVGAGNLSYNFNRFLGLGFGITSLPSTRSTEGQFPYWLGVDDRMTSDEFFRGSYTDGIWAKGALGSKVNYMAMIGNNLSILGVSATQLDAKIDTETFMLNWLPTTGEFGLYQTFGDYDDHQKLATRLGAHFTHSLENAQEQPGTNAIENSQIRLTDGSIIFTPDLFGPGIRVEDVEYRMLSLDAGIKYHGFSLEGEYYRRWLDDFQGPGTSVIAPITDQGYQLQSSAMPIQKILQVYLSGAQIFGDRFGNASELRTGANWYFTKQRGLRWNIEYLHLNNCPVGYTAVPYPVGGSGGVFHVNLEMNF